MAKAETRPEAEEERKGRKDTVRPPESLPDASPFERMLELTRRVVSVPASELAKERRRDEKKRGH